MTDTAKREILIREIEQLPESLFEEMLDFIHFLKTKGRKRKSETAIASELTLKKDWLRPEEDRAWRDL